jgi:hypothetical protein
MSNMIYWTSTIGGKEYAWAINDGRMIHVERTPDIAKLDGNLRALRDQRQTAQTDFDNRFSSAGLPPDMLNAELALVPAINAAIVVAENNLWNELTKETTP